MAAAADGGARDRLASDGPAGRHRAIPDGQTRRPHGRRAAARARAGRRSTAGSARASALLGEVVATQLELLIARKRRRCRTRGAAGPARGVRPDQPQPFASRPRCDAARAGAATRDAAADLERRASCIRGRSRPVEAMIVDEVAAGRLRSARRPRDARLRDRPAGRGVPLQRRAVIRGDHERLREVQAALLGVPRPPAGRAASDATRRAS